MSSSSLVVSSASELAVSSGEAGSARPGEEDTTSADVTAVARPAGEAQPLGIAKQSATTKPEPAETSGEVGSFVVESQWQEQRRRYSSRKLRW